MTDDQLLQRPVVILGSPRSGTTVLSQLLRHHPGVYLANEPRILWRYGNDHRSDMLRPEHATDAVRRHIRRQLAAWTREAGAARLIEKSPSNSLRVPFVDAVLPGCVFVHVMRSGVESVLSIREFWRQHSTGVPRAMLVQRLKEMKLRQMPHYAVEFARRAFGKYAGKGAGRPVWGPRLPGIERMAQDLDLLEVCGLQWRLCVEQACRHGRELPADRYTEVQLEDLNEETLRRILAFCGLAEPDPVVAAFVERFDTSAPSGRSKKANDADLALAADIVAPTQAWLDTLPPAVRH